MPLRQRYGELRWEPRRALPTTSQRQICPAYNKADLRAGVKVNSWSASLFVNNATGTRGVLNVGIGYVLPNAFIYTQPRTVGVSISRSF